MSQQIDAAQFTDALLVVLNETFEQVRGVYLDRGTSLFETLDSISATEASQPVSATCATLAAQVDHTRFYLDVMQASIRGKDLGKVDWDHIWQTVTAVTPEEWQAIKDRLQVSYKQTETLLKTPDDWNGDYVVGDAIAIVTHTAFHLGQIRQSLCTLRS